MYDDEDWTAVTGDELSTILNKISPVDGKYSVSTETTIAGWRTLPFYDQVSLVRVADPTWAKKNLKIYYLIFQGNLFRLNGTSPPIHAVNEQATINLTEDNVLDYLRFYSFFVRGDEGPFLIVEDIKNSDLPQDVDSRSRQVFERFFHPAKIESETKQGSFWCTATVLYAKSLFTARFEVKRDGMVDMLEQEAHAADLPVTIDAPIA